MSLNTLSLSGLSDSLKKHGVMLSIAGGLAVMSTGCDESAVAAKPATTCPDAAPCPEADPCPEASPCDIRQDVEALCKIVENQAGTTVLQIQEDGDITDLCREKKYPPCSSSNTVDCSTCNDADGMCKIITKEGDFAFYLDHKQTEPQIRNALKIENGGLTVCRGPLYPPKPKEETIDLTDLGTGGSGGSAFTNEIDAGTTTTDSTLHDDHVRNGTIDDLQREGRITK